MNKLKFFLLTGLGYSSLLLTSCQSTLLTQPQVAASQKPVIVTLRLLERQIAYRNDRKACIRFRLPFSRNEIYSPSLLIDAYNDDYQYARTLWLELDGIGGYLAANRYMRGQYIGNGVLGTQQRKRFYVNLHNVPMSVNARKFSQVNFERILKEPGEHTLCTWISTYSKFGPNSWVTVDLELETSSQPLTNLKLDGVVWYQGQENLPSEHKYIYRIEKN